VKEVIGTNKEPAIARLMLPAGSLPRAEQRLSSRVNHLLHRVPLIAAYALVSI
jgi:hypothetical protein